MRSDAEDFGRLAQQYCDRYGWTCLPAKGKRPHVRQWQHYQAERPTQQEVAKMFSARGTTGLCVVAGAVSGGLVVRDFDQADSYQQWAVGHHDLASALPTVRTARGFHVLFRAAGIDRISKLDDGELRGGGISLLPTSHHPSGTRYSWLVGPGAEIPLLGDPTSAGLGHIQDTCNELVLGCVGSSSSSVPMSVEQAIQQTLPTGPGQRNRKLFDLARILKFLCPEVSPAQLRMIVADWHQRALPMIRTKPLEESMQDFIVAWTKIESLPLSLERAVEKARAAPTPAIAMHYAEPLQLLVRVCQTLQSGWGDRPFFLSVREAERITGLSRMEAARAFKVLQFDRTLKLETMGTLKGRKASQWRYLG